MSYNDDNPEEVKKAQKKYLWFGYGSYSNSGSVDPVNYTNIRADPGILNKFFELLGVKEEPKKEPEEDRK